ncbi:hypothetical protein C8Q74DRAFT_1250320 [Fomes fomentarius]|nr:hypothetical protein C8Q74DRAFT_1250320 [Fomes fomentarius]
MSTATENYHAPEQPFILILQHDPQETASQNMASIRLLRTWLWSMCRILSSKTRSLHPPQVSPLSVFLFALLFFTYVSQIALLAIITGSLAPLIALIVGAESILLISLVARALFLPHSRTSLMQHSSRIARHNLS